VPLFTSGGSPMASGDGALISNLKKQVTTLNGRRVNSLQQGLTLQRMEAKRAAERKAKKAAAIEKEVAP
jgi:hypothetical protein